MKTTTSENTSSNVENTDNQNLNSELIERLDIKGTPFQLIKISGEEEFAPQDIFIAWGKFRVSESLTYVEANDKVNALERGLADWGIISAMIGAVIITENQNK